MAHEGSVFEGRTLDDAVRKGLEALGLSRAEVMITTLQEGSGGFLGFGSRPYKVRVMPRPGGAISDRDDRERPARRGDRDARPAGRGRDDRGGRGRDERGGRGRDGGRGREERPGGGRGGRGRDERGGRGREDRAGRGAEVRAAGPRSEERGPRSEERGPRGDERGPRTEERAPRLEERGPRREERRDERPRGEERREERRDERPRGDAAPAAAPRSEEREFGRSDRRGGRGRGRGRDRDERSAGPREEQGREERRQEDRRSEDRAVSVERRQDERRAADRPGNAIPAEPIGATGAGGPDDGDRRRRRRGRRGGRGRGERREGMTPAAMPGAPEHGGVATMAMDATDSHELESHELESHEMESHEMESHEMESPAMEIQPAVSGSVAPELDVETPHAPGTDFGSHDDRDRGDRPARHERSERSFDRPRRDRDRDDRGPRHERADDRAPDLTTEQLAAEGKRLTEEFLKAMGFEATVTAEAEGTRVDVTAAITQDEELLTGRKGEVRQALQHLLNRMLNRGEGSRYHLQLEVNEFWKKREEELAELARGLAEQALANGGEAVTEYLNSQERRIIHMTLRSDTRVKTYSLGTGMIKRIAVAPADFEGGPRDEE